MKLLSLQKLAHIGLAVCLSVIAHAGVGIVQFSDEGEVVFDGVRQVKAAGVPGIGGTVVLEEGLWKVGGQTIMVRAGQLTDLDRIKKPGVPNAAPLRQPLRTGILKVEAAADQQWRLAGEDKWRQGSATITVGDGVQRLEWKEGERVTGRLLVSEGAPLESKLPESSKLQPPVTKDGAGTWVTGPSRETDLELGLVSILLDEQKNVVAWRRFGVSESSVSDATARKGVPLVAFDHAKDLASRTNELPQNPILGSGKPLSGWEIVTIAGRDYVTAESIRNFYNPLYGFTTFRLDGNHLWIGSSKFVVKAAIGSQEMLINNIKFILSFPVQSYKGKALFSRLDLCKLIDPVLCTSHIQNPEYFDTVVVDASHGGKDTGAIGVYGIEKDFSIKMAMSVRKELMQRGFKVVLTRADDSFITQGERVKIANETPQSIFVSLHFNAGDSDASGIETYALTPQSASDSDRDTYNVRGYNGNNNDSANISLAVAVHASVISRFKFIDRGVKRAQLPELIGCKRPGIVFKGGFVSNEKECLLISSDTYRSQLSAAIGDAVVNYRRAVETAIEKGG